MIDKHPLTCDFEELPPEDIEPLRPDPGSSIPRTMTHEEFLLHHKQEEWVHWQSSRLARHASTLLPSPLRNKPKKKKASKK